MGRPPDGRERIEEGRTGECRVTEAIEPVPVVVEGELSGSAVWALQRLRRVLRTLDATDVGDDPSVRIFAGTTATSEPGLMLVGAGVAIPTSPEAMAIAFTGNTLAIGGGGDRGLAYALHEVADRLERGRRPIDWSSRFPPIKESPSVRTRSVAVFPHNEEMDASWYFDVEYWRTYFDKLSSNRFNSFSLTFGHQTAYLVPPYAFLVPMPEFPTVTVPQLTNDQREKNLSALQMISRTATERGIDFTFGVWQQHAHEYGESLVEGLTPDNIAAYCRLGMTKVLEACPDIQGVQLRVNVESGILLAESPAFFREIYAGVRAANRDLAIDIRAKAIVDDTWEAALATGMPTTVSTKFWCEHQGMPYHAMLLQDFDRMVRRHSYGDLLKCPRNYDVLFRLWNFGTNKFTVWGDPEWVRTFVSSCALGGSRGFEVCAPLTNKGFRNVGGAWPLFKSSDLHWYQYEDDRYWFWYLLFGRIGYNPQCTEDVWTREFTNRFGAIAGPDVQAAVESGSHFLPFITAAHLPSASVFGWWPERDTGGLIDFYIDVEPSDLGGFYGVGEYVQDYLSGNLRAKLTPLQIADQLDAYAADARAALGRAECVIADGARSEFDGIAADVRLCSGLAIYHAHKMRAALNLAFFYATGDSERLDGAQVEMARAWEAWHDVIRNAEGVYDDEMIFGPVEDESGTWKCLAPYLDHDVNRLQEVETVFERYGLFARGFDFGGEVTQLGPWPSRFVRGAWVERRFDPVSPVEEYSSELGYGWNKTRTIRTSGNIEPSLGAILGRNRDVEVLPSNMLLGDFQCRARNANYPENTFVADLRNGTYDITAMMGDLRPDGEDRGPMWVTFQGRYQTDRFTVAAGQIVERTQRVHVGNGRLELEFNSHPGSDWVVNAVVVREVAPQIGHVPIRTASPGPLRIAATTTAPAGIREVCLNWRIADAPFQALSMTGQGHSWSGCIDVQRGADVTYFIEATDGVGGVSYWPTAGAAGPQRVAVGDPVAPPWVEVERVGSVTPGRDLVVTAQVETVEELDWVRLYYRDLNQRELYTPLSMERHNGVWRATIPGSDIVSSWDLMYYVEVMDRLGNGAIGPDMNREAPYVVVPVDRGQIM